MTKSFSTPHSSNVDSVEFEEQVNQLVVTFKDGASYVVHDADSALYDAFSRAASPGRFYHTKIKDLYRIEKV